MCVRSACLWPNSHVGVPAVSGRLRPQLCQVATLQPADELGVAAGLFAVVDTPVPPLGEGCFVEAGLSFVEFEHQVVFHMTSKIT